MCAKETNSYAHSEPSFMEGVVTLKHESQNKATSYKRQPDVPLTYEGDLHQQGDHGDVGLPHSSLQGRSVHTIAHRPIEDSDGELRRATVMMEHQENP
jgi:hypothetical protein